MAIKLYQNDIPADLDLGKIIAVDTETMGLNWSRDRLCLVQLSSGDGNAHLVQFRKGQYDAPNLCELLNDANTTTLFHFARFDIGILNTYLNINVKNVYCTKIASKLARTYTDRHGLKDLCRELLSIEISKQQQSSDWGRDDLSQQQLEYAASDVYHLHKLKSNLDVMLKREGRQELAEKCFEFLPYRVALDRQGWPDIDIFEH